MMDVDTKEPAQEKGPSAAGSGDGPGRKSKACLECKKLKMKCEVLPGDKKCRHCLRRNVDCIITRRTYHNVQPEAAQKPLDPGVMEKYEHKIDAMRAEIQNMRQSLDAVLTDKYQSAAPNASTTVPETSQPAPQAPANFLQEEQQAAQTLLVVNQSNPPPLATPGSTTSPAGLSGREDNTQMAMTRENSLEPQSNGDPGNGSVTVEDPMGSLYEVTRLRNIRSNKSKTSRPLLEGQGELNDFISRGVISESEAEELYEVFHKSLNHYLWVGLEQTHPSFHSIRKSSELLTATILTVTALHIPTSATTFDACYKEFLSLISSSMFSRYHSIDDVRGLCIAAFWLSEVSWKLSGHAIRIATELNIHQSFSRALEGDKEHFLRARLWYMLYVCDHHFSIAYGRPPMIAESTQIREHELFLQSPYADALDARILSQVSLMQILTRVYERFAEKRTFVLGQARAGLLGKAGSAGPGPWPSTSRPGVPTSMNTTGSAASAHTAPATTNFNSSDINILHGGGGYPATQHSASPHTSIKSTPGHGTEHSNAGSGDPFGVDPRSNIPTTNVNDNGTVTPPSNDPAAAMLTESDLEALRDFNLEIDQWRILWYKRQTTNYFIGTFPPKGIILYSYFAKLQLNSLAVRGVSLSSTSPGGNSRLSTGRKEFANMAISAAASILTFVLEEDDMRRALVGTPLYVHTMIAFASVFLMKVATKWNRVMGLNVEEDYVSRLLGRMIDVLKSTVTSDRHVLRHIAAGLEKMLVTMEESRARRNAGTEEQREASSEKIHEEDTINGVSGGGQDFQEGPYYRDPTATYTSGSTFPPGLSKPVEGSMGRQMPAPGSWVPEEPYTRANPDVAEIDFFGDGLAGLNDNLMYEAFGTGSANDVYNLLSSQFSFY